MHQLIPGVAGMDGLLSDPVSHPALAATAGVEASGEGLAWVLAGAVASAEDSGQALAEGLAGGPTVGTRRHCRQRTHQYGITYTQAFEATRKEVFLCLDLMEQDPWARAL